MPDPRVDGYTERAADEVLALLALSRGRALVLTSATARPSRPPTPGAPAADELLRGAQQIPAGSGDQLCTHATVGGGGSGSDDVLLARAKTIQVSRKQVTGAPGW